MQRIAARLAAFLFLLAPALPAEAQHIGTFGVWRLECLATGHALRPPALAPAARYCVLAQLVAADEERRQIVLAATVEFPDGTDVPVLRFRMAPAIRRESGLGVKVGDLTEMRLPIADCDRRACVAAGILTAEVQARLESGSVGEVNFMMADGRMLPVPLGLIGFAEGMAALREAQARP